MKLIRGALIGAATLAFAAAPTVASAGVASKLSLRSATKSTGASRAVPTIPYWAAGLLVGGVIIGAVVVSTQKPDSA